MLLNGCADQSPSQNVGSLAQSKRTAQMTPAIPRATMSPALPGQTAVKAKVAILLPLTGHNAALGQAMLNAAQQAVFDSAATNFELMPRDTGDNEAKAESAARDAIASGAQLVIGPIFAQNVPVVHLQAQAANVSMLTLSTDTSLAAPGLYVMGFAPGAQVARVVSYAAQHGATRIAALVPSNAYGAVVDQALHIAAGNAGANLIEIDTYDAAQHDTSSYVQALAAKRDAIDAVLIAAGGPELQQIATQLQAAGFDPRTTHILGTGLWDTQGLATQVPFAVGGWYAASDPAGRRNFTAAYYATYGQDAPRLTTLAYDATALAAILAKRGAHYDQATLTNPNGFAGIDGIFRLMPQGLVDRGLAVLQVDANGPTVIDPAPNRFGR